MNWERLYILVPPLLHLLHVLRVLSGVEVSPALQSATAGADINLRENAQVHRSVGSVPCGFVFTRDGVLYRQISESARRHYEQLIRSGLLPPAHPATWSPTKKCPPASRQTDGRFASLAPSVSVSAKPSSRPLR